MNSYLFHVPGEGPYMEVVVSVDGKTLDYKEIETGVFRSSVEIIMVVYKGNEIASYKKINLESDDLAKGEYADLMSVERFPLPNGNYSFEVTIKDLLTISGSSETQVSPWVINHPENSPFVSSVEFIGAYSPTTEENAFSKSGFDIVPWVSSHFESSSEVMMYYAELYNTDKSFGEGGAFVFQSYVANADGTPIENTKRIKREKAKPVIAGIHQMDIKGLATGDYLMVLEIRDKNNELIHSGSSPFTRTFIPSLVKVEPTKDEVAQSFAASFTNKDSLYAVIESHLPIANTLERNSIDNAVPVATLEQMQSFIYSFWLSHSPENPEAGYRSYKGEVDVAQKAFATRIRKGWQTDRGRVYLQYGRPNTRIERPHSTDYFPFEIWHYYETKNLHDRRFLFYNPTLGGDYELLHSDIPGEIQNQDWKLLARQRGMDTPVNTSQRQYDNRDTYSGDELEELFYNPR
ncbi:MAG: GWxTD domain-containing protein [Flavobacteriales bacterium]|nr:GWxTD domain-containing protein [Flavobacteriales bacterium]